MKNLIVLALVLAVALIAVPASADPKVSTPDLIRNKASAEIEINKKVTKRSRIAWAFGKDIVENVGFSNVSMVEDDQGWYTKITYKIDLD